MARRRIWEPDSGHSDLPPNNEEAPIQGDLDVGDYGGINYGSNFSDPYGDDSVRNWVLSVNEDIPMDTLPSEHDSAANPPILNHQALDEEFNAAMAEFVNSDTLVTSPAMNDQALDEEFDAAMAEFAHSDTLVTSPAMNDQVSPPVFPPDFSLGSQSVEPHSIFLRLPAASPEFQMPRYERVGIPVSHLTGLFPNPLPYLPQGPVESYLLFEETTHHRAAAAFCAAAAADMCVIVDGWARSFGLPGGLSMEQSYVLSRHALALLLPHHPAFGPDGLATFHSVLGIYFAGLMELRQRVPVPEPCGDPAVPEYFTQLPDPYAPS